MNRSALLVLPLLIAPACADSAGPGDDDVFIAFESDFAGYHSWHAFPATWSLPGGEHLSGPRTVYANALPDPASGEFPVGTIFVKESGDGDPSTREVFASVKRGGNFNATGAVGWEWFQLANGPDDHPTITWRGLGPATGDAYGGQAVGGCNGCHNLSQWDYAWSAEEFGLLHDPSHS